MKDIFLIFQGERGGIRKAALVTLSTVTENTISLTYSVIRKYRYFYHLEPSILPFARLFFSTRIVLNNLQYHTLLNF